MSDTLPKPAILDYARQLSKLAKAFYADQHAHLAARLECTAAEEAADKYLEETNPDLWRRLVSARTGRTLSKEAAETSRNAMTILASEAVDNYPQRDQYEQFLPQGLDVRAKTEVILLARQPQDIATVAEWMCRHGLKDNVIFKFTGALEFFRQMKKANLLPKDGLGNFIDLETNPEVTVKAIERWEEFKGSDLDDGFDERGRIPDETTATPESLVFHHPITENWLFKDGDIVTILPVTMDTDHLAVTKGKVAFTSNMFIFSGKTDSARNQFAIDELIEALIEGDVVVTRHAPA